MSDKSQPSPESLGVVDPILGDMGPESQVYGTLLESNLKLSLSIPRKAYYYLRPFIPSSLRREMQSMRRLQVQNDWYRTELLLDVYKGVLGEATFIDKVQGLWPTGYRSAIVLTHDVETARGFGFIREVLALEQKHGFVSSWNLVPYLYPIKEDVVSLIRDSSCEIGIHGYNHDGKLYFSKRVFEKRLPYINNALKKFDAVGYRNPAVHRNLKWQQQLEILYDASCFDIDPYQPIPGGCHSIWPFKVGKFVELPYTLPQDHVIWIQLKEKTNRIWEDKINWLYENHGMILIIIHPDYLMLGSNMERYEELLKYIAGLPYVWRALPKDMAAYWNHRFTEHNMPESYLSVRQN